MQTLGIISIILGLLAIIYLSLKRVNLIIAAPAAAIVVILFKRLNLS